MKTILPICLTGILSLITHHNTTAQISSIPFTEAVSTKILANTYSLKVTNFNGSINKSKVLLNWMVEENQDADQFEVQRSSDGNSYEMAALVFGTDSAERNAYKFYEKAKKIKTYYRVKIIGKNGAVTFSEIYIALPVRNKGKLL
jgi:ADP-ribosylglycohydrolase